HLSRIGYTRRTAARPSFVEHRRPSGALRCGTETHATTTRSLSMRFRSMPSRLLALTALCAALATASAARAQSTWSGTAAARASGDTSGVATMVDEQGRRAIATLHHELSSVSQSAPLVAANWQALG